MIPVQDQEQSFDKKERSKKERDFLSRILDRTEAQTNHQGRGEIVEGEEGGFPSWMGFKPISPACGDQKKDRESEIDPGEIEAVRIEPSQPRQELNPQKRRQSPCQADFPDQVRSAVNDHGDESMGYAEMSNGSKGCEHHTAE
jgi:hypothetical protein